MKIAAAAGAVAVSLVLASCGSGPKAQQGVASSANPERAVQAAVSNLEGQSDVKMVLSLPITPAQVQQLSSDSKGKGKSVTQAEADAISGGSIFVNLATGGGEPLGSPQARTDPKDSFDLGVTIHGNIPLEVIYTGGALYAQAHLQQLLTDVGQDPAKATQFAKELGALEGYVPGISHLAEGGWVEIDPAGLKSLAPLLQQIGSGSGSLKADLLSLPGQVMAALDGNSTFRSTGAGRYAVTVKVAQFMAALRPGVDKALSDIPVVGTRIDSALAKMQAKVPAGQTAVIDLATSGGKLSLARLDLSQFAGKGRVGFPVPLQVAFSSPGAPKAPPDAQILDVSKLPGLLGALLGHPSGTKSPT